MLPDTKTHAQVRRVGHSALISDLRADPLIIVMTKIQTDPFGELEQNCGCARMGGAKPRHYTDASGNSIVGQRRWGRAGTFMR